MRQRTEITPEPFEPEVSSVVDGRQML